MLPRVSYLRPVEQAWIHTWAEHGGDRRDQVELQTLPGQVLAALGRCELGGRITSAHVGVLVMHGARGGPPSEGCAIARRLWTEAMDVLDREMRGSGVLH